MPSRAGRSDRDSCRDLLRPPDGLHIMLTGLTDPFRQEPAMVHHWCEHTAALRLRSGLKPPERDGV